MDDAFGPSPVLCHNATFAFAKRGTGDGQLINTNAQFIDTMLAVTDILLLQSFAGSFVSSSCVHVYRSQPTLPAALLVNANSQLPVTLAGYGLDYPSRLGCSITPFDCPLLAD
jgi:hypothetical protein